MTLYDFLLAALNSIDAWLVANPDDSPQRQRVYAARKRLSLAMDTIVGVELNAALGALGSDAVNLQACTTRLVNVAKTIDTAQTIVADVGKVVSLLGTVAGAVAGLGLV
jgi:hypothetical protein